MHRAFKALGELVLHPDAWGIAVRGRRTVVVFRFIAPCTEVSKQLGTFTPGVSPGHHVGNLVVTGQRIDVVPRVAVAGFVGQCVALGNSPAPIRRQRIQLLRTIGGNHPRILNGARQRRALAVLRYQTITTTFGFSLPAQADIRVFTVVDDRGVGGAQNVHAKIHAQLILVERTDKTVSGCNVGTRHTLLLRRQE
ncbi:hypothetical protein D3C77_328930 [compost metagenome]